jgi:hypothetical protein
MAAVKRSGTGRTTAKSGRRANKAKPIRSATRRAQATMQAAAPQRRGRPPAKLGRSNRQQGGADSLLPAAGEAMRQASARSERLVRHGIQRGSRQLDSAIGAAMPMADGMERLMRSWMGYFQRAAINQSRLMQEMMMLGAAADTMQAQLAFFDRNMRNLSEGANELLEASGQVVSPLSAAPGAAANWWAERMGQAYRDHGQAEATLRRASGNGMAAGEAGRRAGAHG